MAKIISKHPDWLMAKQVVDIYSVSNCVSEDFANYIVYWKHNGYWFFNSPDIIKDLSKDNSIDLTKTQMFYYEAFELEYDEKQNKWQSFQAESSFETNVVIPLKKQLEGYDVVTSESSSVAGCSPLSCNHLADKIETNVHCLLNTLEEAKKHLEDGDFCNSEPGPYRIIAVYSIEDDYMNANSNMTI